MNTWTASFLVYTSPKKNASYSGIRRGQRFCHLRPLEAPGIRNRVKSMKLYCRQWQTASLSYWKWHEKNPPPVTLSASKRVSRCPCGTLQYNVPRGIENNQPKSKRSATHSRQLICKHINCFLLKQSMKIACWRIRITVKPRANDRSDRRIVSASFFISGGY